MRALVDRFYDLMELDPQFALLRSLHPERLDGSRDKLYMFLSGWLGGPALYVERHGHPRLRARHLPFPIATAERDQWLACMHQAMRDFDVARRPRGTSHARVRRHGRLDAQPRRLGTGPG